MASAVHISEAVSLGAHAAICLGSDPTRYWSTREICRRFRFSEAHLAKVMHALARAGLVEAVRGPRGGARLRRPPERITLLEIHEAIDGPMTMGNCLLGRNGCGLTCCQLGPKLADYNRAIRELFTVTTLADLVRQFPAGVPCAETAGKT